VAHKGIVRMRRGPKHPDASGRQVNDEHRIARHETSPCPRRSREDIGSGDRSPMRAKKRLP
jgi:hypothetical protein